MQRYYPYLQETYYSDKGESRKFLKSLDSYINQKRYVRITLLDFEENPLKEIQGELSSGSLTVDGASSVRRACSFAASVNSGEYDIDDQEADFALNKKVFLEIGIKNFSNMYTEFPILWFPQGVFLISNFSVSSSTTSAVNISVNLKDKMCLLNGDAGGTLPATTIFDEMETQSPDGAIVINKVLIFNIIMELVNHFGGEDLTKIIIDDVPSRIRKIMRWNGSVPIYYINKNGSYSFSYTEPEKDDPTVTSYKRYVNGQDIGYIYSDFVYDQELVGSPGEAVTSILDKIKGYLGNYEYFYDAFGNFHFQEVKNYLNTTQAKTVLDDMDKNDYLVEVTSGKSIYAFEDDSNLISISRTPQYDKIKNDFVVQGLRKMTSASVSYPVRYHLAIDSKPAIGNTYDVILYVEKDTKVKKAWVPLGFVSQDNFPDVGNINIAYHNISENKYYQWDGEEYVEIVDAKRMLITTKDWRTELYLYGEQGKVLGIDQGYYYPELANEWPALYDLEKQQFYAEADIPEGAQLITSELSAGNYYLDFIDTDAALAQFNVKNIGRRTKVLVNEDVNCLFEPEIEDIVVLNTEDPNFQDLKNECDVLDQAYVQTPPDIYNGFIIGGHYNAAFEQIKFLLYQNTSYQNTLSLQALPVFYLEPNTRAYISDKSTNTYGDYIIQSMTIPLDPGSTMSVSCNEALERF